LPQRRAKARSAGTDDQQWRLQVEFFFRCDDDRAHHAPINPLTEWRLIFVDICRAPADDFSGAIDKFTSQERTFTRPVSSTPSNGE